MTSNEKGFFAYPANPSQIARTIGFAHQEIAVRNVQVEVQTWEELDIVGHFISTEVLNGINSSDFFIADISELNFNVTYEIGYAIGKSKRLLLVRDRSYKPVGANIAETGIFDTIGYGEYQNAVELTDLIIGAVKTSPLDIVYDINTRAPVYILDTQYKTDWSTRIVSRVKKSGYTFRSFDPNEQPRLSANDAIAHVSQSLGVVVPLVSSRTENHLVHNLRGAFISGLAAGMGKETCLLQDGDDPVPLDYRDLVNTSYHPDDLNEFVADFAVLVAKASQRGRTTTPKTEKTFLKTLNLGSSSAENEMRDLENYYLETDQHLKCLRGEAQIVVGRKGSGKSAIFLQIRDSERQKNRSKNIVLDLKPDGYKLIKFKENMLTFLEGGTYLHTITAFWEYVLLLEVCYKILEKDKKRHINDHHLYDGYRELADVYNVDDYEAAGDFSERMSMLMESIYSEFRSQHTDETNVRLTGAQVTELVHKHDVHDLKSKLISYMEKKGTLWLLFDNIDNGWPTTGLERADLLIIRSLVDATRKIEREFGRNNLDIKTAIFLRNDVYELLVSETADRGKEASVALDWTDSDLLRELVRLRMVSNGLGVDSSFPDVWSKLFVSHFKGEETSQYLIDRSLMRPRFLLNLINHCKSYAINLNHEIILESDIDKGMAAYSSDILRDIGYEMRDINNITEDALYAFIGCEPELSKQQTLNLLTQFGLTDDTAEDVFELLIWYGFMGISSLDSDPRYIYDFRYNKKIMDGVMDRSPAGSKYVINHAFRPSLEIDSL